MPSSGGPDRSGDTYDLIVGGGGIRCVMIAGGPAGLFSVVGVKYTTARRVAARILGKAGLLRRGIAH